MGSSQSLLWGQQLCWHRPYPDGLISTYFRFPLFSYSPNPHFPARGVDSPGWLRTWCSKECLEHQSSCLHFLNAGFPGLCLYACILSYFCKDLRLHSEIFVAKISAILKGVMEASTPAYYFYWEGEAREMYTVHNWIFRKKSVKAYVVSCLMLW